MLEGSCARNSSSQVSQGTFVSAKAFDICSGHAFLSCSLEFFTRTVPDTGRSFLKSNIFLLKLKVGFHALGHGLGFALPTVLGNA